MKAKIGSYEVLGELGQGGMGAVLRARDSRLGVEVAIKVLRDQRATSPTARERFRREAHVLERLEHPHLVPVLGFGEEDGAPFIVMELIAGETLDDLVRGRGPLPPADAAALTAKLADALAYAHAQGVLHRDVKPSNVLLDADGEPRLTDFGLARELGPQEPERLTRTGQMLGSPGFWAPEQAAGELDLVGPATDVYGLGATLYYTLTGVPPVDGLTFQELITATASSPPAPPHELNPDVPPWLSAVCLRCLQKAPASRYADPAELETALAPRPTSSRAPWVAAGAAGALLASVALASAVALRAGPNPAPASTPAAPVVPPDPYAASLEPTPAPSPEPGPARRPAPKATPVTIALGALPPAADAALQAALARQREGDLRAAELLLTQAIERFPDQAEFPYRRGLLRTTRRELAGGIRDLDRALELRPEHPKALFARAQAHWLNRALAAAERDLEAVLAQLPESIPALNLLIRILMQQKRLRALLPLLDRLQALKPADASVLRTRAQLKTDLGDPAGAIADYRASLKLDARAPKAWYNLGNLLAKRGRLSEAAAAFGRAGDLDHVRALYNLGVALQRLQRNDEAVAAFTRCLVREPDNGKALGNRGISHLERGDPAAALKDLERAVKLAPTPLHVRALGQALAGLDREEEALARYDEAIRLDGRAPRGWISRGLLRLKRGEHQEAYADLRQALQRGGGVLAATPFARACQQLGKPDEARTLLRTMIRHAEQTAKPAETEAERLVDRDRRAKLAEWRALLKELGE